MARNINLREHLTMLGKSAKEPYYAGPAEVGKWLSGLESYFTKAVGAATPRSLPRFQVGMYVNIKADVWLGDLQTLGLQARDRVIGWLATEGVRRARAHATPPEMTEWKGATVTIKGMSLESLPEKHRGHYNVYGPGPHPHSDWGDMFPDWEDTGDLARGIHAEAVIIGPDQGRVRILSEILSGRKENERYNMDLEMGWISPGGHIYRYPFMQPAMEWLRQNADDIIAGADLPGWLVRQWTHG